MASLVALAATITKESQNLAKAIKSNGLPEPGFGIDAPGSFPTSVDDKALQASRMTLIDAAHDLAILAEGPVENMRWQAWNQYNDNISLQAIMHFRLAEVVPTEKSISFAEVASTTGLAEPLVTRILRFAVTYRVFCEPTPGYIAHNVSSLALRDNLEQVTDWLDMTFVEWAPAATRTVDALRLYPGSQETNESGFSLAHRNENIFDFLAKRPLRAKIFGSAMASLSAGETHKIEHLCRNYDWNALGSKTLVDIGGSHGHISIPIAKSAPKLNVIVQDLPHNAAEGERMCPPELAGRVKFMGHNMQDPQPVKGAAIYMFRSVLHNWPDKYVIKFLSNVVPALEPGSKIIINEGVLAEPGVLNSFEDKVIRGLDLCMIGTFNAKERTMEEWADIFRRVNPGLKFLGAKKPETGLLWIIEAVWEGGPQAVTNGH